MESHSLKSINQNMPATSRRVVATRRTEHFSRNVLHRRRPDSYTSHGTAHESEARHMRHDTINLPASLCLPAVSTRSVDPQCRNSTQCRAGNASRTHADPPLLGLGASAQGARQFGEYKREKDAPVEFSNQILKTGPKNSG